MFLTNCVLILNGIFKIELIIYIKMDLALYNLQKLICHKTKPNQTKPKPSVWLLIICILCTYISADSTGLIFFCHTDNIPLKI